MEMTHDLIVIGGGSGGVAGSRRAAAHGAKVAIVEADRFGGTCVIRGCVPKKLMMYAAGFAHQFKDAAGFGWSDVQARFEMSRWADAKKREIDRLEKIYDDMLVNAGVETVRGRGRLVSANEVDVGGRRLAAPRLLVATGGAPSTDAFPGLAAAMTSNDVLDLREVPASLLVIGGGYIAVEFASILAGLGSRVTLAYRDKWPLRGFDDELRGRLALALGERGITLACGAALQRLERDADGFALHRAGRPQRHRAQAQYGGSRAGGSRRAGRREGRDRRRRREPQHGAHDLGRRRRHRPRQPDAGRHRRGARVRRHRVRQGSEARRPPHRWARCPRHGRSRVGRETP